MTASVTGGVKVERDTEGFLVHGEQWTEELAQELAHESGIGERTTRHWHVIKSIRAAFVDHGALPWVQTLSEVSAIPSEQLYELFPHSPSRLVTKIAGMPKNRSCL